jgi:hypothetical protein
MGTKDGKSVDTVMIKDISNLQILLLKYMLDKTMGATKAWDARKNELRFVDEHGKKRRTAFNEAAVKDNLILKSFLTQVDTKGLTTRYVQLADIVHVDASGKELYVHGAITNSEWVPNSEVLRYTVEGFTNGKINEELLWKYDRNDFRTTFMTKFDQTKPSTNTPTKFAEAWNTWKRERVHAWINHPAAQGQSTNFHVDGLIAFATRTGGQASPIVDSYVDENSTRSDEPTFDEGIFERSQSAIAFFRYAGVQFIGTGHKPVGQVPLWKARDGLIVVCADLSYSTAYGNKPSASPPVLIVESNDVDINVNIRGILEGKEKATEDKINKLDELMHDTHMSVRPGYLAGKSEDKAKLAYDVLVHVMNHHAISMVNDALLSTDAEYLGDAQPKMMRPTGSDEVAANVHKVMFV